MDGYVTIGTELDTKSFDKQIKEIEYQLKEIDYELSHAKELKLDQRTIDEYMLKAEKLNNQLIALKKKQVDLNKTDFSNLGKGLTNIIKKVSKWSLAVFGVRSAYMAIRNAIDIISENDEQLKADIDYMKNAFAYTLEPVVRTIVNLVKELMIAIRNIIFAITGKNIFENANKSLKGAVGTAKELKKQLAGFDEMNVLGDNSSTSGGGVSPSFDLSNIENVDTSGIYTWLEKVKEIFNTAFQSIKENVKSVMSDLGFGEGFINAWDFAIEGVKKIFDGLLDTIEIILQIIVGLATGDTKKVKDAFAKVVDTIKNLFLGLLQTLIGIFGMIRNGIADMISSILGLFKNLGIKVGEVVASAFKAVINAVLSKIENILNEPIKTINSLIYKINEVPGINLSRLSTFKLPRLAKGGIVNMPSRGVPVGNAIAGERGAEGVIPLTDSQQMALLGEAIGKYITVNAQMNNYMDGRLINRQLEKIQNETNFAMNR